MEVGWEPNTPVSGGTWEDVFEPLPNVVFRRPAGGPEVWDVAMFAPSNWQEAHRLLIPRPAPQARIDAIKASMGGPYAAMHIRRTDHVPNTLARGDKVQGDEDYMAWVDGLPPGMRVYLATDNGETQRKFLDWAGAEQAAVANFATCRVAIGTPLPGKATAPIHDCRRNGTLADAVVDLFMCAGASQFMGTHASSFSETVKRIQVANG
jgi:hypothetical protein